MLNTEYPCIFQEKKKRLYYPPDKKQYDDLCKCKLNENKWIAITKCPMEFATNEEFKKALEE